MASDLELLQTDGEKAEEAFRELVQRHGGMVHAVALRMLRDTHRAEEVT